MGIFTGRTKTILLFFFVLVSASLLPAEDYWKTMTWKEILAEKRVEDLSGGTYRKSLQQSTLPIVLGASLGGVLGLGAVLFSPAAKGSASSESADSDSKGVGIGDFALGLVLGAGIGGALFAWADLAGASPSQTHKYTLDLASDTFVEPAVWYQFFYVLGYGDKYPRLWDPKAESSNRLVSNLILSTNTVGDKVLTGIKVDPIGIGGAYLAEITVINKFQLPISVEFPVDMVLWYDYGNWHSHVLAKTDYDQALSSLKSGSVASELVKYLVPNIPSEDIEDMDTSAPLRVRAAADGQGYLVVYSSRSGGTDQGVLIGKSGNSYRGKVSEGIPEGPWTSDTDPDPLQFLNGIPAIREDKTLNELLSGIESAKEKVTGLIDSLGNRLGLGGLGAEDNAAITDLLDKQSQAEKKLEPYNLAAAFNGTRLDSLTTPDGTSWNLKELEQETVKDKDGRTLEIHRKASADGKTQEGAYALNLSFEDIELRAAPVSNVFLFSGMGSAGFGLSANSTGLNGGLGVNGRWFNNHGKDLPGPEGGQGKGLDIRVSGNYSFNADSFKSQDSDGQGRTDWNTSSQFGIAGSLGYTWYNFDVLDATTLQQKGSGSTVGLKLGYQHALGEAGERQDAAGKLLGAYSPFLGLLASGFIVAPLFSFDTYRYNPGAVKYSASSLSVTYTPPFNFGFTFSWSF